MTLVLSSEPGVGLVRRDCGTERVPAAAEVFVEGFKIDETFGRLGTGITWQEWKNGGKDEEGVRCIKPWEFHVGTSVSVGRLLSACRVCKEQLNILRLLENVVEHQAYFPLVLS